MLLLGCRSNAIAFGEHETPESAAIVNQAIALLRARQSRAAVPVLEDGLRKFPNSATIHFEYGNVLNDLDDYPHAIAEFKKAIELDPPFPEAVVNIGYALLNSNRPDEAAEWFQKYLAGNPKDDTAKSVKSQLCIIQANRFSEQDRFFDAKKLLEEAASYNPDNAHVHFKLGRAFQGLGNSKRAIQEYEETLRLQPNHSAAAFNIAGCYQDMGMSSEAIGWFERYLAMNPAAQDRNTIINMIAKLKQKSMEPGSDPNAADYLPAVSPNGRLCRWQQAKFPLKVFIDKCKDSQFQASYSNDLAEALNAWSDATHNHLNFTIVKSRKKADIACDWTTNPYEIRRNGTDAEQGICNAQLEEHPSYIVVQSATIRLLILDRETQRPLSDDEMKKVCLHELGHALGLQGHSTNNHDIMFFSMSPTVWPVLSKRDKATIARLYNY
jgi:tetratricopeptide (TPR) repeat protein